MTGLLRSEYLKVITTKVWWTMLLGLLGILALALLINGVIAAEALDNDFNNQSLNQLAAGIYTSGQYFGVLFSAILGTLLITNEFHHQTATSTFLATPRRVEVVIAKLVVAVGWGVLYGLMCTVISIPVGAAILSSLDSESALGEGDVLKAILLNLLAFGVWAVLGLGIGTLLQNQVGAVVTLIVAYFGAQVIGAILLALGEAWDWDWLGGVYYYLPYGATQVMTSADKIADNAPAWWGGMLLVLLYGAVAAFFGSWLTAKRDIT
jgi:ABC-type transport system involved in multi-copper enzyme maturation permease subunit